MQFKDCAPIELSVCLVCSADMIRETQQMYLQYNELKKCALAPEDIL